MPAALTAASATAPDAGLFAAIIVAAGVTALVALGMMLLALHRSSRLTLLRAIGTAGLALGVVAVASLGVVAVSPTSAQAGPNGGGPPVSEPVDDGLDIQLPTLPQD